MAKIREVCDEQRQRQVALGYDPNDPKTPIVAKFECCRLGCQTECHLICDDGTVLCYDGPVRLPNFAH